MNFEEKKQLDDLNKSIKKYKKQIILNDIMFFVGLIVIIVAAIIFKKENENSVNNNGIIFVVIIGVIISLVGYISNLSIKHRVKELEVDLNKSISNK